VNNGLASEASGRRKGHLEMGGEQAAKGLVQTKMVVILDGVTQFVVFDV